MTSVCTNQYKGILLFLWPLPTYEEFLPSGLASACGSGSHVEFWSWKQTPGNVHSTLSPLPSITIVLFLWFSPHTPYLYFSMSLVATHPGIHMCRLMELWVQVGRAAWLWTNVKIVAIPKHISSPPVQRSNVDEAIPAVSVPSTTSEGLQYAQIFSQRYGNKSQTQCKLTRRDTILLSILH